MSSTVDKALELLTHFTQGRPQVGLSELARLAKHDKATVHRMLVVLAKHGLVEQNNESKLYRLGAEVLRLAYIREACFPITAVVGPILENLCEQTGETTHASLASGGNLATIGMVMGKKAIHVTLDAGESLPFHATASGAACLAFMPDEQVAAILKRKLPAFTEHTPTNPEQVLKNISQAKLRGYAVADQSYEADVVGIAVPFFGADGISCGAVAVATPANRMSKNVRLQTIRFVLDAAAELTKRTGGSLPNAFLQTRNKAAA